MAASAVHSTQLDQLAIRTELGLSRERMARIFDVSAKTIERWESGIGAPSNEFNRKLLYQLAEIVELGELVYGEDGCRVFLQTPVGAFEGATPFSLLTRGEQHRVLDILTQDYEGLGA